MTTKILNTAVTGGYTLSAAYSALYAYSSITGASYYGYSGFVGGAGGVGLTSAHGAVVHNNGVITGGDGGPGSYPQTGVPLPGYPGDPGYVGGAGGAGVSLTGGTLVNYEQIFGGAGGKGGTGGPGGSGANGGNGGAGGAGGAGVTLAGASLTNDYFISGGAGGMGGSGGAGGAGGSAGAKGPGGAAGDGVDVIGGGTITNDSGATISGSIGVKDTGAGGVTITNFATIAGMTNSVAFTAATDRLIALAGSTFIGAVAGGGGTLELEDGAGTITSLGAAGAITGDIVMTFGGFGTYVFDKGSSLTLEGSSVLAAGQTLTNAGTVSNVGGLDVSGALVNTGQFDGGVGVAAGAITNLGAITGGVDMTAGRLTNGSASTTAATVSGDTYGVYANTTAPATVTNFGTIQGGTVGGLDAGVWLNDGGRITNGSATDAKALISGFRGVYINGPTSTVTNFGTIEGAGGVAVAFGYATDRLIVEAGSSLIGVAQGGGGSLELAKGTGAISGLGTAFTSFGRYLVDTGGTWTLTGANTLAAGTTLTNSGQLIVTGSLTNLGMVKGAVDAVGGAVSNLGAITAGVALTAGGVTNGSATVTKAQISAVAYGVYATAAAPASVTNFGTIKGGTGGGLDAGVWLNDGGPVTNGSATDTTALISGFRGVYIDGPTSTVTNYGAIEGTGGVAVAFAYDTDRLIIEAGSRLIGVAQGGGGTLELAQGTGTITGLGTAFTGFGQYQIDAGGTWTLTGANTVAAGTTLTNAGLLTLAGSLVNDGAIKGTASGSTSAGVHIGGGALTNGSAAITSALITGAQNGVYADGSGLSVTNFGAITGTANIGVRMQLGGSLTNGSAVDTGALISGGIDGFYADAASTVTNFGTIAGVAVDGARMNGGVLTNGSVSDTKASITGIAEGVYALYASVANFGTISAKSGGGAYLYGAGLNGAVLTNGSASDHTASITGITQGVYAKNASTITNFGVIEGAVSVKLNNAAGRLIVEAGSLLTGVAQGGGGTLELAKGAGSITGLGKAYTGFGQYTVDSGGTWALSGTNTIAAAFGGAGTLSLTGGATTLKAGGALTVAKLNQGGATSVLSIATSTTFAGVLTQTAGTVSVASSNTLTLSGKSDSFAGTLAGAGTVSIAGGGAVTLNAGAKVTVTALGLTQAGSKLTLATSLSYGGTLTQGAATTLALGANALTLTKAATLSGAVTGTGGSLVFARGAETIDAGASLAMSNWTIGGGAAVTLATTLTYGHTFTESVSTLTVAAGKTPDAQRAGGAFAAPTVDGGGLTT